MLHILSVNEFLNSYKNYDELPSNIMYKNISFTKSEDLNNGMVWYNAWNVYHPFLGKTNNIAIIVSEPGSLIWNAEIDSRKLVDESGKPETFSTPENAIDFAMNAKQSNLQ